MGFSDADLVGDAGPEFDPQDAPPAPDLEKLEPDLDPGDDEGWLETQVRDLLTTQGGATNWLLRLHPDDETWIHTREDLAAITPPLTRILNRYDATRAAAAAGDEIALGSALFNYAARNYTQRRRLIRQLQAVEEPVSGVRAPEGTGPPPAPPAPGMAADPEPPALILDPDAPPNLNPTGGAW